MSFILTYTTAKDMREAKAISQSLLSKKLAACVNFIKAESSYIWKGEIESGKEIVMILKTDSRNWEKIKKEIKRIHSYDLPCIIRIQAETNKDFSNWVESEIN